MSAVFAGSMGMDSTAAGIRWRWDVAMQCFGEERLLPTVVLCYSSSAMRLLTTMM